MKYTMGHNKSGIKVGDTVKILRKAKNRERGWENGWIPEMDMAVGKIGLVVNDKKEIGFDLEVKEVKIGKNQIVLSYPYFVLEKVKVAPKKKGK